MASIGSHQDGLDVSQPDVTTQEEIAAYRAAYAGTNKGLLDSYEFWLEFRPDVLKRHKARTRHYASVIEPTYPLVLILGAIHLYTVTSFREGVAYEIRLAQTLGASRAEILDTLSIAYMQSGHRGMYAAAASGDYLRTYEEPEPREARFPAGWTFDPGALDSGMDYTTRDATPEDMARLRDWYERTLGEVPRYAELLMRTRPGLLKAHRNRYEHAIRDGLPTQMMAWCQLNSSVARGSGDGIRENVLLGRALGMTGEQLLDAICFAVLPSGVGALNLVEDVVGEILAEMAESGAADSVA